MTSSICFAVCEEAVYWYSVVGSYRTQMLSSLSGTGVAVGSGFFHGQFEQLERRNAVRTNMNIALLRITMNTPGRIQRIINDGDFNHSHLPFACANMNRTVPDGSFPFLPPALRHTQVLPYGCNH